MKNNLNIAFITPRISGIGGAEKYVCEKILWLKKNGYNCIVIAGNHTTSNSPYLEKLKKEGIGYYNVSWINTPYYLLNQKYLEIKIEELNLILKENQINLIETNQIVCGIYAYNLSVKYKVPILLNVLSELGFEKNTNYIELLKNFDKKKLYYNLGSNSNKYIERETGEKLENCKNIPIPITWNKNLEITDKNFILSVARFDVGKEYLFSLIEDFRKIKLLNRNDIPKNLIIVGDGIYREKIEKRVNEIDRELGEKSIILKGFLTGIELENLYSECSVYVGMGTTLLTAAAYKKPCVVATIDKKNDYKSIGYFRKEPDGGYSFGQPLQNSKFESYYYYILKLYESEKIKKSVILESYNFIQEYFSLESVMKKWEKEYGKISENFIHFEKLYYIPKYRLDMYLKVYLKNYKIITRLLKLKKAYIK
ncbi:MAG: glycosyltransferase [Fusobacteriaceae bacterium]